MRNFKHLVTKIFVGKVFAIGTVSVLGTWLLFGCGSDVDSKIVKKYEMSLNKTFRENIEEILGKDSKMNLNFSPFTCKGDGDLIVCDSKDISIVDSEGKGFKMDSLQTQTNSYYVGDKTGVISIKEFYENVFARYKEDAKAQTSFYVRNLTSTDNLKKVEKDEIDKKFANDVKMTGYMKKLADARFDIEFNSSILKGDDKELGYDQDIRIYDPNNNVSVVLSPVKLDSKIFEILESGGVKFDLDSYTLTQNENLGKQMLLNIISIAKLNGLKLEANLDKGGGVFDTHINELKESVKGVTGEQFGDLGKKLTNALDSLSKSRTYKAVLEISLKKDTPLMVLVGNVTSGDYLNSVEKISVNDEDFTKELEVLVAFVKAMHVE